MTELCIIQGMNKEDEKRLDDIFSQIYCKAENNNLRFGEFMQFILDREMINAKFDLEFYFTQYFDAYNLEEIVAKTTKTSKKQTKDDTIRFSKSKFLRMVEKLGQLIYHSHKKNLDLIIRDIFQDHKKRNEIRVMAYDDQNKRILNEATIKVLIDLSHNFQALFTVYQPENYYRGEIMLNWREVRLMNLRIPISSFITFLIDAAIFPTQYSAENIEDLCLKMIPPISIKENQFFQSNAIPLTADQILNGKFKYKTFDGDPKIGFVDFQFMMARMALEITSKDGQLDSKKDPAQAIKKFFHDIGLDGNRRESRQEDLPRHLQLIAKIQDEPQKMHTNESQKDQKEEDILEQNYLFMTRMPEKLDYRELVNLFENEFPPFPQLYTQKDLSKQFTEGVKEKERRDELAKKLEEDKKNKNKPAPKQPQKKGEQKPVFQWEPMNPPERMCSYQYFIDYLSQVQRTNKLRDISQLASLSHITAAPVLLPECLYPQDPPEQVRQFVEASMMAFAQQNYYQAITNLTYAQELWSQKHELFDSQMIFFEYFAGQIYEIGGQDEAALNRFLRVKFHSDRLQRPYCGFGSVLYHMQEYELSVRAFTRARALREAAIGDENIENGLTFNNLGCALHQLGHLFSAETCYQFAITLFDLHLGPMHSISLNAKRNLSKLKQNKYQK